MLGMFQVTAGSSISSEITLIKSKVSPQKNAITSLEISKHSAGRGRVGGGWILITQTNGLKISAGHTLRFTTSPVLSHKPNFYITN